MQTLTINNIKEFYQLIIDLKLDGKCDIVVQAYGGTLGGCTCNKKAREVYANTVYISYLNNPYNKFIFDRIKEVKKVDKIIFKNNSEEILKEI